MFNSGGTRSHYFSLESILVTQERVPCVFQQTIKQAGFLDPSSQSEDLEAGTKLDLPYWTAKMFHSLNSTNKTVIEITLPKIFKENYRDILHADASLVDLTKHSKYFYKFGKLIINIPLRESPEIQILLQQTFKDRFRKIFDLAQHLVSDFHGNPKLDKLELEILDRARKSQAALDAWLCYGASCITTADMVVNHKKRKLADIS
ncbi:hypothetical protein M8J76_015966 [Diaphorina citri]|nr:hypothetical protein M8J75_003479 [Diaphorina citri]KAI5745974.1 hypothetical protein M8J76_015966 [Diaphorina citri]